MKFTIGFDRRDAEKLHEMWGKILETQRWSEGTFTDEFEAKWGQSVGVKAVAFSSWAGGALAALEFFNVRGRTVLCPANTFMATPLSVVKAGGEVEFVDCNKEDLCMSLVDLKEKIERFHPIAVFVVHIGGHIAFQINEIAELCRSKGIILIEDCAHAHGASWCGKRAGTWGDAGIYSFYATKTISTGEGGMLVTSNPALIDFAKKYRNYGKFEYEVRGLNYRMSEFTAAIGCVETDRLDEIVAWKNNYAKNVLDPQYPDRLKFPAGMISGYYKYIIFNPIEKSTGKVYTAPDAPCHKKFNKNYELPNTEWIMNNHWCVPIYYRGDEGEKEVNKPIMPTVTPFGGKFKKVMVTGGSGFIGSHVVDKLIDLGIKVRIYDLVYPDFLSAYPSERKNMVEYYQGSLTEIDRLRMASTGIDAIYHLAAVANVNDVAADPTYANKINIDGTFNVLEIARINKIKRVIFASTVWVYQNTPETNGLLTEEASLSHPDHFYTATKITSEMQCVSYTKMYNLPVTILRFGIPYGTRARGAVVTAIFTNKALKGETISIEGDGSQYRKFVNVEDLADGCVLALNEIAENKIYNLEGDEKVTIKQIADTVNELVGNVKIEYKEGRKADFSGKNISNQKAKIELGWSPRISFKEGMKKYIEWCKQTES